MLFILVMDVLNSLFRKAGDLGLLQPLSRRHQTHRISLYADDVALFIRPVEDEMNLTMEILGHFGEASGLYTNLQKSCVIPIRCEDSQMELVDQTLPCTTAEFPCTYLGLPISDRHLKKAELMVWIDKIGNKLPGWQASLMNMAGRTAWVRFVLSAIPIYALIAIKVPKWFIKAINKLRRAFLWKGRNQVNGGSCLVAWEKVQRPLHLGGLGILNLEIMSWALQIRWLWFQKTDSNRPWKGLDIPVHSNAVALFDISIVSQVGQGTSTLFWTDKWLFGCSLMDLAPAVVAAVPIKTRKHRTVAEAFLERRWPRDIQAGLSLVGLYEYFQLWDALLEVNLSDDNDQHSWRWEASGSFSTKSAYQAFFNGAITFEPWRRLWKSWAPAKCKVFLWLAIRNKCWTADRLAKRGLPHPDNCMFCDQADEDIQHVLVGCVFAREFWYKILASVGLQTCAPNQSDEVFADWWRRARKRADKIKRKGLNSLIILGAWILWKHRNACVFEGARPSIQHILQNFSLERKLWHLAGAHSLQAIGPGETPSSHSLAC
jgi:hypothetical protein